MKKQYENLEGKTNEELEALVAEKRRSEMLDELNGVSTPQSEINKVGGIEVHPLSQLAIAAASPNQATIKSFQAIDWLTATVMIVLGITLIVAWNTF